MNNISKFVLYSPLNLIVSMDIVHKLNVIQLYFVQKYLLRLQKFKISLCTFMTYTNHKTKYNIYSTT